MELKITPVSISLNWKGPFDLSTNVSKFMPPASPGVYLWTVAESKGNLISYIGKAKDINHRFCEHIIYTLGGWSCLYDDKYFHDGGFPIASYNPVAPYKPGRLSNLLTNFIPSFRNVAFKNLLSYKFYWVEVIYPEKLSKSAENVFLESVESALITSAKEHKQQPLQNSSVSRGPDKSISISLINPFPESTAIADYCPVINYGKKPLY